MVSPDTYYGPESYSPNRIPRQAAAQCTQERGQNADQPGAQAFNDAYPQINLYLMVDIVAKGYDTGIRYGATVPQDTIAVPLTAELRWIMIASPDDIARNGILQKEAAVD